MVARTAASVAALAFTAVSGARADEVSDDAEAIAEAVGTWLAQADAPAPAQRAAPGSAEASEQPEPSESETFAPSETGIEVLQVKGRGVGQIETEVQSSVTQFDASTIEALGAQNIADLSRVTPNVNIVQPGNTQATFFVRGIGLSDFSSNAAGAVTILQDDVAINAPAIQTGQLYDIETVDIVRGPQGTGHFRNASAGAILVRSKRPTGNYGAQLRSSLGQYRDKGDKGARHAWIQDYEGALEAPILADTLSSRFAFRLREAEPYRKNGCGYALPFDQRQVRIGPTLAEARAKAMCGEGRGASTFMFPITLPRSTSQVPFGLPKWVNDEHNWAARGTLRFQPRETEMEFFLSGHGSRLDQDSVLGQVVGTRRSAGTPQAQPFYGQTAGTYEEADAFAELEWLCDRDATGNCRNQYTNTLLAKNIATRPLDERPYRGDYNRVGQDHRDAYGAFLSGEGPITDDISLFGVTSFDQYVRSTDNDTDFTSEQLFELVQDDKAWQLWNEIELRGELPTEPVQWNLGGYYLREHLHNNGLLLLGLAGGGSIDIHRIYEQDISSFGVWGGFSWDFADDFTLDGGVRYNYEKKKFRFHLIQVNNGRFVTVNERRTPDDTWQTPTGEITLTYHLSEASSLYAKYARGFKAGHFNALASTNLDQPPAEEEYNDAWEVGLRGGWLGGAVSLGVAGFYYRYENYQVFLFSDSADTSSAPVLEILNAKQAENYGIEVEGQIAPLRGWAPRFAEGLRLSGNFGWLHGEYLDFNRVTIISLAGSPVVPINASYAGLALQNAPEYKASGTAEWTFDFGRWGYLIPRYDINWTDDVFFDPNEGHGTIDATGRPALPDFAIGQKGYYLQNVRLAYRTPTGNVEVAGWIRNFEDKVYKNYAFDASRFTGITINFPGQPRSIGADIIITF